MPLFNPSRALAVLWQQNTSAYVPRVLPSALVGGEYLLRYPNPAAVAVQHTEGSSGDRRPSCCPSPDRRRGGGSGKTPLASTTWRAKYICENPSEGTSLVAFTPCCAADVDAILRYAVANEEGKQRDALSRKAALEVARALWEVLRAHSGLLAGAEALQTGVPVAHVAASLRAAEAALSDAMDSLSSPAPREGGGGESDGTTVALCVTPAALSLAHGLQATAAALLCGRYAHVIWCPSCDAAVSAMWLMQKLRERVGAVTEGGSVKPASVSDAFSVALTGDPETHLLPACYASLARAQHQWPPVSVAVLAHGLTPTAAKRLDKAGERTTTRAAPATATATAAVSASVSVAHSQLSIPNVCVVKQPYCGAAPASASLSDLGEWVLEHSLSYQLRSPANSSLSLTQRVPLLFVPNPQTAVGLLGYLARHGLGHRAMRLGHSLDPTRRLGPLSSAAHLAAVKAVVRAATQRGARVAVDAFASPQRKGKHPGSVDVLWRQVCGGFDFPLMASKARLYVPAVLYTDLDALVKPLAEAGDTEGEAEEALALSAAAVGCSVQQLTEPLEEMYGGTAGASVFLCGYPTESGAGPASSKAVCEGVERFVAEMAANGLPWGVCDDATVACPQQTSCS